MGRPKGSPNKRRAFRAALMRLLDPDGGADPKLMEEVALAMIAKAKAGDVNAATFLRDTMEGKPPQAIVGDSEEAPVSMVFTGVPRAGDVIAPLVSNEDDTNQDAFAHGVSH